MTCMDKRLEAIYQSILDGDLEMTIKQVQVALADQIEVEQILQESLIAAMEEVGRRFEVGEYFVPEMLISARAMQGGLGLLKPLLIDTKVKATGKIIIGTVVGDLHDIGKNLVSMMLEGAGFEVIDLGVNVKPEAFVNAVRENQPDIVAMSALLTTTMPNMETVIKALKEAGLRDQVKVMVGGAPVTNDFALRIGADGSAPDASQAVKLAKALMA